MTNAIAGTTATQEEAQVPAATLEESHNETREMPHAATQEMPPTTREEPWMPSKLLQEILPNILLLCDFVNILLHSGIDFLLPATQILNQFHIFQVFQL